MVDMTLNLIELSSSLALTKNCCKKVHSREATCNQTTGMMFLKVDLYINSSPKLVKHNV